MPSPIRKVIGAVIFFVALIFFVCLALHSIEQQKNNEVDLKKVTLPVIGVKAYRQTMAEKIDFVGTIQADDSVDIKSEIEGVIEKVNFDSGKKVKKGDILLSFRQEKLKAAFFGAEANLILAQSTLSRYQRLLKSGGISRLDFDQAANQVKVTQALVNASKADFNSSVVRAPFDGILSQCLVSVGQFLSRGDNISFLINPNVMKINFRIPERYLTQVTMDQGIAVTAEVYPQEPFEGAITFIDPRIDEATRTVLITAKMSNPQEKLKEGMFGTVSLTFNEKPNALVVPEEAIVLKENLTFVYTVRADGTVTIKPVETGFHLNGLVEILKGLDKGQIVITEGFQKVQSGSKVKVRLQDKTNEII